MFLHSTNRRKVAVVENRNKLIVDRKDGIVELYDLASDPLERDNLADENPAVMPSLSCKLQRWMKQHGL